MRESPEWRELLEINSKSRQVWTLSDEERKSEETEIVAAAIAWIGRNPNLVLDMLGLSMGEVHYGLLRYTYSPLLLEALGHSGNTEIIAPIEKRLEKCRRKVCQHSRYLMKALMLLESPESYQAITKLVRTSIFKRRNYLTSAFVDLMDEKPTPELLPILLDITRKTRVRYKVDTVLARLADANAISFEELLEDKSKKIRCIAVDALNRSDERHLNAILLEKLERIVHNKREDILCRSYAADILKKKGIEVPFQFKDRIWENTSADVKRFVRGMLYPDKRPDDWAITEFVKITYRDDMYRVELTCRLGGLTSANIRVWRGQFWDAFVMMFRIEKRFWPRGTYSVAGMCRSIMFRTGGFRVSFLIEHLDRLLITQANRNARYAGNDYSKALRRANALFSKGFDPQERFWEYDEDRIKSN